MTWRDSSGSILIAAVSDGHGGEAYYNSALGARFACETAIDTLREVATGVKSLHSHDVRRLADTVCRAIIAGWNQKVDAARGTHRVKTFGCTLIAYLQTAEYWLCLQIGDGKFATIDRNGEWDQPVPWDDKCILNITTSMCDPSAIEEFRFAWGDELPTAAFLSSDGIDSTFEDGELLYNFYARVMQTALDEGIDSVTSQLPDVLAHFSKIGSQDDMSIAAILNHP